MFKKCLSALIALLLLIAPCALADDAGALTGREMTAWLDDLLLSVKDASPLNDPATEDALTQDGYAFIYDMATLFYDRPVLSLDSALLAISVTDESLADPRGVRLNDPQEKLLSLYGWENPKLAGDESIAPLYAIDQLPQSAYWAWAQREGDLITAVQCAVHALSGEEYTDMGVRYMLSDGAVTAITIYGLNNTASPDTVAGNLDVVNALKSGANQSDALPFSQDDLVFSGLDFTALTESAAAQAFGAAGVENWSQDDPDHWMHTVERTDVMITYLTDGEKQNERCAALLIAREGFSGPRGIRLGDELDSVLDKFTRVADGFSLPSGATVLYGDGVNAPCAILEPNGEAVVTVNYSAIMTLPSGEERPVNLYLTFFDGALIEMMIYSW